ncbi:hypothetical protein CJU90_0094 [Yarrowia sp. C11]|nr:hypothetical protein CKK34_1505 [Yarrowia sp. E02]KAG5372454.1 hypothetical protein CJU90_0094 [Yarrowia sp. C11]
MSDKRRAELCVPYVHVVDKQNDAQSFITTSLPMAAMFLRNKLMSWTALFTAITAYMNEPLIKPTQSDGASQPAWLSVLVSLVGLFTCYMDLAFPSQGRKLAAQHAASATASSASSTASAASATVASVASKATGVAADALDKLFKKAA